MDAPPSVRVGFAAYFDQSCKGSVSIYKYVHTCGDSGAVGTQTIKDGFFELLETLVHFFEQYVDLPRAYLSPKLLSA